MKTLLRFGQAKRSNKNKGTKDQFAKLLKSRKELIALFSVLTQTHPFVANTNITNKKFKKNLGIFCDKLVDYTALGHFDFFSKVNISKPEKSLEIKTSNAALMQQIHTAKDYALDFVENYNNFIVTELDESVGIDADDFRKDMANLMITLEELRFKPEDRIIKRQRIKDLLQKERQKLSKKSKSKGGNRKPK